MATLGLFDITGNLDTTTISNCASLIADAGSEASPAITSNTGQLPGIFFDGVGMNFVAPVSGTNETFIRVGSLTFEILKRFGSSYSLQDSASFISTLSASSGFHIDGGNGIAMQWGLSTIAPGATASITFPITYPETPIILTGLRAPSAGAYHAFSKAYSISGSGCTLKNENIGLPATGNAIIQWMSVGEIY